MEKKPWRHRIACCKHGPLIDAAYGFCRACCDEGADLLAWSRTADRGQMPAGPYPRERALAEYTPEQLHSPPA